MSFLHWHLSQGQVRFVVLQGTRSHSRVPFLGNLAAPYAELRMCMVTARALTAQHSISSSRWQGRRRPHPLCLLGSLRLICLSDAFLTRDLHITEAVCNTRVQHRQPDVVGGHPGTHEECPVAMQTCRWNVKDRMQKRSSRPFASCVYLTPFMVSFASLSLPEVTLTVIIPVVLHTRTLASELPLGMPRGTFCCKHFTI